MALRVKDSPLSFAIGRVSVREPRNFIDADTMTLAGTLDTDSGLGVHIRLAQHVSHGIELSAELATAEIEHFDIDVNYNERHTVVSASIGYRFF